MLPHHRPEDFHGGLIQLGTCLSQPVERKKECGETENDPPTAFGTEVVVEENHTDDAGAVPDLASEVKVRFGAQFGAYF